MSLEACARIVERGDPERFASLMAAPLSVREKLVPLYAFNVEVARAPWVTQEAMIAQMRLQWWADVLGEIAAGGPVRRHEVATALAATLSPDTAEKLGALVEARRWDCYAEKFDDDDALWDYLGATSGQLYAAAAATLGAPETAAIARLGQAAGLAAFLRATPALLAAGKKPWPDPAPEHLRALARQALTQYQQARRAIPPQARPATRAAWLTVPLLRAAIKAPERVATGLPLPSEARKRGALLWRGLFNRA